MHYSGSRLFVFIFLAATACFPPDSAMAEIQRAQVIRFLGVTVAHETLGVRKGAVGELVVGWEERTDHHGLIVSFQVGVGSFSPDTELAILAAIDRAARSAGMRTDSWNVSFTVHEPAGKIYGDSLSGIAGLTVVALAKGDFIPLDRTMTGTITPDGEIGPVTAVPLKIEAAHRKHLRRVIVPDTLDASDADWITPFLMQVSPVHSAAGAYQALTGRTLISSDPLAAIQR